MLAVDNSPHSFDAARRALEFQKAWGSQVIAFHSIEHHMAPRILSAMNSFFYPASSVAVPDYIKIEEESIAKGNILLDKIKAIFEMENGQIDIRLVEDVSPKHYIEKTVDSEEFDLVLIGCKGEHTKLGELLLGSVAHDAVNNAKCDVLVVR